MNAVAPQGRGLELPFVQLHDWPATASDERWQLAISRSAPAGATPPAGHRLLLVLDGNLGAIPAALMQHTRAERGVGDLPASTVVGVGYPDVRFYDAGRRAHDYLPPLPPGHGADTPGGRADAFAALLDEHLLPWLEAQQGVPFTEVGLFGHSYGGLFALYKLLYRTGRINAFFSISPSLWWADGWLLDQLHDAASRCQDRKLYLGIGAYERAMPGDDAQRMALHAERDLQGRYARLVAALQAQRVDFTAETFAGEDHGSVLYPALTRAVRWLMRPA